MAISLVYQATRTRVAGGPDVSSGASFLIQPSTSSPGCSATAACECEMLIDVAFGSVFLATLAVPAWEPTRGELSSLQPRPGVRVCLRVLCANVWRIQLQLRQQQRGRYSHSLIQTPLRGLGINSREAKLRLSFLQETCVTLHPMLGFTGARDWGGGRPVGSLSLGPKAWRGRRFRRLYSTDGPASC